MLLGVGIGDDVREFEEARLHRRGDTVAESYLFDDLDGVYVIELDMLFRDRVFHARGKLFVHFFGGPGAVEQEYAAVFEIADHVVLDDVRRVVARDEVRLIDEVGALDRFVAEPQVGNGDTARLLGVVSEISLRVFFGVVADDLDRVLVAADGAVRAETVELAADRAGGSRVDLLGDGQRAPGHVVVDADGEVAHRLFGVHVLEHGVDHRGVELLAAEPVSAADDLDVAARLVEGGDDVEIERFARAAALFDAVEHGDLLDARGDRSRKLRDVERTIEPDFEHAGLAAVRVEIVDRLFDRLRAAAHQNDDLFGVLRAVVFIQRVASAGDLEHVVHRLFDDRGDGVVILVARLSSLEVDVGVLRGASLSGVLGVERARLEFLDVGHVLFVDDLLDVGIVDHLHLGDLVRGAEAVEEVQEGDP